MTLHPPRNARMPASVDPIAQSVIQIAKQAATSYPPYDIAQIGDTRLRITVAVAGFAIDDISLTVTGRALVIRGRRPPTTEPSTWLHRGIAMRQFQRTFALGSAVTVAGANLDRGLLSIDLDVSAVEAAAGSAEIPERKAPPPAYGAALGPAAGR